MSVPYPRRQSHNPELAAVVREWTDDTIVTDQLAFLHRHLGGG
jgi:hypothetical protein